MADLGKIAMTDGGNYSASTTYEKLTFVHYQGDAYMTLKTVKGVTPTDDGVNYKLFCKSAELATASKAGIVMPDGTTTTVNSSGKMSAKQATQSTTGIVKGSNSINVGSDGAIDVNTEFTQAANLANIIAEEAIATILGKVSKAIATTMNLNQNALLKSMLTSIDANDSSKIPTAAYIHTLVERIGMGTKLTAGANLTEAANNLNSNLPYIDTSKKIKDGFANGTSWTATENCIVCGSIGFNSSAHGCYVSVNSVTIFWVNNDAATNSFAPVCFAVHKGDAIKFIGYDNQVPILTNLYAFSTK